MTEPLCTAEARYWRDGLRWKVVLQIMYTDATLGRGEGPFFPIGHPWSQAKARAMTKHANARLARSESAIRNDLPSLHLSPQG